MPLPHDVPTAAQLVESVREFLERDVLPSSSGRLRFHTLVAANVLGMVERELAEGARHEAEHRERLARLGYPDDAALAAAIRAGDLDDRYADVHGELLGAVRAKLEVAHPGYADA
ncbi:DUF6285 domain-containing protein [Actinocorallia sp. A-T 12471]|uniref:DUF6285 domain-containing protein n=1 Tax=Actinocorallia sp. A-T 12471 TaxID=3089813 RepID=UPI0029D2F0FA|nr:DUF6285 domain-containing protein [Actinocorallia sp. A-T 12471]MDX6738746.1 DUF6285 domain-containing protein [Actinocorallia sp. A-T 12471]